MKITEQELINKLEEAEAKVLTVRLLLTEAKKAWTDTETLLVEVKLIRDRARETLRVHRNTTIIVPPTMKELELEKFRETYPEICVWAKERDLKK